MKRTIIAAITLLMAVTLQAQRRVNNHLYNPDPAPVVSGDRLYVFTGHDLDTATYFRMPDWQLFSTTDMEHWTDHGVVLTTAHFKWAKQGDNAWASQAIERNGKWYWYVAAEDTTKHIHGIGVAVADRPEGPWADPIGRPLIPGDWGFIDPTVFIDDDGQAWLFWGNNGCWYAKLNEDMISIDKSFANNGICDMRPMLDDEAQFGPKCLKMDYQLHKRVMKTGFEEAPWIYKIGDTYFLEYAAGGVPEHWAYSTAKSIHGPWHYEGRITDESPGSFTIHGGTIDFKGKSYLFYHDGIPSGGNGFRRTTAFREFQRMKDGRIPKIDILSRAENTVTKMFPENGATDVNIDTHLTLTMTEDATVGQRGFVSVYDRKTGKLVDRLDMSIPAGPTQGQPVNPAAQYTPVPYIYKSQNITNRNTKAGTPSGVNARDTSRYQLDIIGGFSDGFHFYPIITQGRQLTIYLHHNVLEYGHEYYVTIDEGVIEGFKGLRGKKAWTFRTKVKAPDNNQRLLTVSADGTGDFSTVQGAMDFIPDSITSENDGYRVLVKNGDYEELVYFRNKRFVTIEGESREGVLIHYPNNEVFNPHPADIKTNEVRGTFPSRRAAFAADNCSDLTFRNLTLKTDCKGQAEGLLVNGERNFFENVHVIGDGDALQANGSCYWLNCRIDGGGDTILGRGPSFFNHCTITSRGAFMWIRNTEENHGNVFVDCHLKGLTEYAEIGRLPDNKGKNYPHAECVLLNCTLEHIPAYGWGRIDEGAQTATILEFNSHDAEGRALDLSKRHPLMRQLDPIRDAALIGKYSDSHWVLGWNITYEPSASHRHQSHDTWSEPR